MHPRILPYAAALSLACLPARALNVAGHVIDKTGTPLWTAKVCVTSDLTNCVTTDIQGAFHIQTAAGIRGTVPEVSPYLMNMRNGMLSLTSPSAQEARMEWIGPGGRALAPARTLELSRGRNAIALPSGLPTSGVCAIRLRTEALTVTWKAVLMGSQGSATAKGSASAARIVALSKAETAGTLLVTKTGYKNRTYAPYGDPETDALIFLSTTDDVGLNYAGIFHDKVLSIDRTAKQIITQTVSSYCDSTDLVRDTTVDTSFYAFRDGKFLLWYKGECAGQSFTGTGTDPVGNWTMVDPNMELPADLRTGCTPDSSGGNPPFDTYTSTYGITETVLTGNLSVEFCPADLYGPLVAQLFSADTNVTLGKNTCKQVVFLNAKNESGTLNFAKEGDDSLQVSFKYKSSTCSFVQPMYFGETDPTCPEDDTFTPFFICLSGQGFSDSLSTGGLLGKTSAMTVPSLPMSKELGMSLEGSVREFSAFRPGKEMRSQSVPASPRRESIFPFYGWRPKSSR